MRAWLLALLITLAGCAGTDTTAPVDSVDGGAEGGGDPGDASPASAEGAVDAPDAPSTDTPPAVNITAAMSEGVVPFTVNITIDVADVDGDAVSWTLSLDDARVADGTQSDTVGVLIEAAGNHTISVVATAAGNSSAASLAVTGIAAGPREVTAADTPDDVAVPVLDIVSLKAELGGDGIDAVFTVKDVVYPVEAGATAWKYRLKVSGHDFSTYVWAPGNPTSTSGDHSVLWDHSNAVFMDAGFAVWDADADTVSIHIPYSVLEGLGALAPYEISGESLSGLIASSPVDRSQDLVPDTGVVTLG